ncbi:MAG: glutathione peroxidase [Candidatus Omnitrophica bacterium]|nr:glutathione peroxidase [Candidatus Omnitrophota bacterium]
MNPVQAAQTAYSYKVLDIEGKQVDLARYAGKVCLVVNTASKCGFTRQYASLEKLYQQFRDQGFEVLAFPANDFGNQEPGSDEEIKGFCSTRFGVSFPLFSKISVKGDQIHPLYAHLTQNSEFKGAIKWNFTKFLVDQEGRVVGRFSSMKDPLSKEVVEMIEALLQQGHA